MMVFFRKKERLWLIYFDNYKHLLKSSQYTNLVLLIYKESWNQKGIMLMWNVVPHNATKELCNIMLFAHFQLIVLASLASLKKLTVPLLQGHFTHMTGDHKE